MFDLDFLSILLIFYTVVYVYSLQTPLLSTINDEDADLARQACCATANLAEIMENQNKIVRSGGIEKLIKALGSKNKNVLRESARALGNLAGK